MDLDQFLIVFFISLLGAIVQGSTSMGYALVVAPVLMLINPAFVPVPVLMSGFVLSIYLMLRERKTIILTGLGYSVFGRILGSILATYIIVLIADAYFALVFGVMIILAVVLSLIRGHWEITQPKLFAAGILSGIMGTTASIGSPPMALLYQHQDAKIIRGTLSAYFTLGTLISITALATVGKLGRIEFELFLWMLPAFTLGFWLSKYVTKYLDKGYFRLSILLISALSALFLIGKTVLQMF